IPFTLYDTGTAEVVWSPDPAEVADAPVDWKQTIIRQLVMEERARVTPTADDHYQLVLPLHEGGQLVLLAVGVLPALARTQPDAAQEHIRLQKWLQSVQVRLRGSNQTLSRSRAEAKHESTVGSAWEALLAVEQLARRLRTHKEPLKYQ